MQTGGLILVILGIIVVYGAVTGKLDCFLTALNTCYSADTGAAATQTSLPGVSSPGLPSLNIPTLSAPSIGQQQAALIFS